MLSIYNSLTKKKEIFKPLQTNKVGLYVCGITVYDHCHIGHARMFLSFDVVVRYLRYKGYEVTYVRNITDIDDKIIERAALNQEPYEQLTARFIASMQKDVTDLQTLAPTIEPRATVYMPHMINLIQSLIDKGYAYVASNHDVYYSVSALKSYGCLAHAKLDSLQSGSRVDVNPYKNNPLDFVVWKMAKPGEPAWDSPWGKGRPGWHTECSAMSLDILGETFDIHGGGPDLKFPHHENERAQSEAHTNKKFVNIWMHTGYLQKDKEKMSKSLNNFLTIQAFLAEYHRDVLRYFMISSHYRSPLEYSLELIDAAKRGITRLYTALKDVTLGEKPTASEYEARFTKAMDDDFNTPEALAVLFDLSREINRLKLENKEKAEKFAALLQYLGQVLGLFTQSCEEFLQHKSVNTAGKTLTNSEIEALIEQRNEAKKNKDYAAADAIRQQLLTFKIILEDKAQGTEWRIG